MRQEVEMGDKERIVGAMIDLNYNHCICIRLLMYDA
jgi:hypothetical protein